LKKFFLVSQVFYPDEVSTASLFTVLCRQLVIKGIDVEVWAGQPSYTHAKKWIKDTIFKGINIKYIFSSNFSKRRMVGRSINILTYIISASLKLLFSKEKTPVFTHTTPPFMGIIISFICKIKKRKFIYIILDIFPEGLIRIGKISRKNPLAKIWSMLFIRSLKGSDKIIVLGRDMIEYLKCVNPELIKKAIYIPHWQDENLLFPSDYNENNFVLENHLGNKFVVQYSGNMGLWNEMRILGKTVKKNITDVVFMFIGDGIRKAELLEEFSIQEQDNVILLPFQPSENFNNMINASHVQIVTMKKGLEGMAVPCKIYGILAAGKPVIALVPDNSEIAYIVKEEDCGFVIKPDDINGLVQKIKLLKSNAKLRNRMGLNSRKAFEQKYTTKIIAGQYISLISELS